MPKTEVTGELPVETLQTAEARYKALFERSLIMIYLHDFSGNFLEANDAALNALGYSRAELPSINFARLLSEDQSPKAFNTLKELKETGSQKTITEYQLRKKDGSLIWVETEAALVYRNGKPYAIQGIARNITVQKLELKRAEEQFQILFEQSPASITLIDTFGKVLDCNTATEKLIGYQKEAICGKAFIDILTLAPEDLPELVKRYEMLMNDRELDSFDLRIRRKNGEIRWVNVLVSIVKRGKEVLGFLIIANDITDRKKAEWELRESIAKREAIEDMLRKSEAKLRTMIESSPDAITVTNLEGTIVDCNQATIELHRFKSREEVIGKNAFILFPPAELQRATENLKKTLEQGILKNVEYTLLTQDGQEFPAELSASVIRDLMGNPIAFIAISKNIAERKQNEYQLQMALEKIQTQNEELKEVDRLKDEFYSNITHEYRTPLIAIRGFVELLLQSTSLTAEQKGDLEIVLRNEHRLEQLINNMLEYSRLKSGRIPLKKDKFRVSEICTEMRKELFPLVAEKHLEIVETIQPDNEVFLDRHYITSVIKNLLTNAIKFSFPNGQIIIHSSVLEGVWIFSMRDFGIGIAREEIPQIFERFVKLKASEMMNPNGIGIGLTICQNIIKAYGGKIWAESEGLNTGVTLTFQIELC